VVGAPVGSRAVGDPNTPATVPSEPIPAATVVLLRDGVRGLETLMLRRDANLAFAGGAWVFPGGRVDPEDRPADGTGGDTDLAELTAARNAAAREAMEEAGLTIDAETLVWFAHWTPQQSIERRFATWFFAARAPQGAVVIDDGEIRDHEWVAPDEVLRRHAAGEISLLPPTWMTLRLLGAHARVDDALARMDADEPSVYQTRLGRQEGVLVAMWDGDAGYESGEVDRPGPRHRLWLGDAGWRLEQSG
jgi:8-oxo-dGTP pyrophosphatase MutT (NUDIX family)